MREPLKEHKHAFAGIVIALVSLLAAATAGNANAGAPWPDPCPGGPRGTS